ncbi:MAG: M48 family metallopeptidase [Dehalococcoidia bacterium]|nr:M48 family metallopeptidase [Dehalococcoidia bacterium]
MEYPLRRESRKTIGIYIVHGCVEVRAPFKTPKSVINEFVTSKNAWIAKRLAIVQKQQQMKQEFVLSYGSKLLWRGQEIPLLGDSNDNRIWRDDSGFHLPPNLDADSLKNNVIRLYKICAHNYLAERVMHFAQIMGDEPHNLKITNAKVRWGSCIKRIPQKAKRTNASSSLSLSKMLRNLQTATGKPLYNICFSWRLVMAEDDVIDAVVVHELAHIKEMNHSAQFYRLVKSVLPDYEERDSKLKILSKRLEYENWEI